MMEKNDVSDFDHMSAVTAEAIADNVDARMKPLIVPQIKVSERSLIRIFLKCPQNTYGEQTNHTSTRSSKSGRI
jgi:hypothetical protein